MAPAETTIIKVRYLMVIVLLLALVFLFLPHETRAEAAHSLAPVQMQVQKGDQVMIRGFQGSVEYQVSEASNVIRVEVVEDASKTSEKYKDEWQFSFKREGSEIQVRIEGPASKQVWAEVLAEQNQPEFFIKVTGPSLPVHINWNEGKIEIHNLLNSLNVTSIKSDVIVSKGQGDLSVTNQEGSVIVRDRKGQVKVDSYLAKVRIENVEGKIDLQNFTGESRVENVTGDVHFNTFKGASHLTSVKGRIEFKNGIAPLRIEKFEGELRGRSGQGAVYADVRGVADVRVESAEGAVNLKMNSSGAWVNLGTAEGTLAVPGFLKLTRLSSQQIRSGRLRGSSGGSVFVRTTSGDIRLR